MRFTGKSRDSYFLFILNVYATLLLYMNLYEFDCTDQLTERSGYKSILSLSLSMRNEDK